VGYHHLAHLDIPPGEAGWVDYDEPLEMLRRMGLQRLYGLGGDPSPRKLRLAAVAAARGVAHLMADPRGPRALEVAERHADGRAAEGELAAARGAAEAARVAAEAASRGAPRPAAGLPAWMPSPLQVAYFVAAFAAEAAAKAADARLLEVGAPGAFHRAQLAVRYAADPSDPRGDVGLRAADEEARRQAELLRCVFGNPFRPVAFDPAWRTPAVVALARSASDERELPSGHLDAARLLVLADLLEEAGATDAWLLGHLRGPGPHALGCFALDAVLGKE
jgi:hypothetical protein